MTYEKIGIIYILQEIKKNFSPEQYASCCTFDVIWSCIQCLFFCGEKQLIILFKHNKIDERFKQTTRYAKETHYQIIQPI